MDKKEKTVNITLTEKQFRHLLDLVYAGNTMLSTVVAEPGERVPVYDEIVREVFRHCPDCGLDKLVSITKSYKTHEVAAWPSREYMSGGIEEALDAYDDQVFFESLAKELALHDFDSVETMEEMLAYNDRVEEYMEEFENNGADNVILNKEL